MMAKWKTLCALSLVSAMCLTTTSCSTWSNQHYYEQAQLLLGQGECLEASQLFQELGEYEDSAEYALYAAALSALQEGNTALCRVNLEQIDPFKSSQRYLRYLDAIEAEKNGDLQEALTLFSALGSFEDAAERAGALQSAIPERSIQQARQLMNDGAYEDARALLLSLNGYGQSTALAEACTAAMSRKAYLAAEELLAQGDYEGAMNAFSDMGDTLDAVNRAAQCRSLLMKELEDAFQQVTLESAQALSDRLLSLTDDPSFAALLAQLRERFGVNLELLECAQGQQPYVLLGQYPMGESGTMSDVLWQVIRTDGSTITLLCASVIDACDVATTSDLTISQSPDMLSITLPAAADLTTLNDLSCAVTPYAAAQGAEHASGTAVYWLRDALENGLHPVIGASGHLTLPDDAATPGIRPMATLDLNEYAFTTGSGTREDPYR